MEITITLIVIMLLWIGIIVLAQDMYKANKILLTIIISGIFILGIKYIDNKIKYQNTQSASGKFEDLTEEQATYVACKDVVYLYELNNK